MAASNKQAAIGQKGVSRAEQIERRSIRHGWRASLPDFEAYRIEQKDGAVMLIHAARKVGPASPEQNLSVRQQVCVHGDVRQLNGLLPQTDLRRRRLMQGAVSVAT